MFSNFQTFFEKVFQVSLSPNRLLCKLFSRFITSGNLFKNCPVFVGSAKVDKVSSLPNVWRKFFDENLLVMDGMQHCGLACVSKYMSASFAMKQKAHY
ncbi:hypothetical protein DN068_03505 [Taibaiella soli]|uniref:Uncharacterized protein n=1 Tax=Taibaiella soli TaxID=1649169 RepID=A0A2W2BMH7_9BACT|nr:hypothetical protein DN068_03505 [Taibaiella soli]